MTESISFSYPVDVSNLFYFKNTRYYSLSEHFRMTFAEFDAYCEDILNLEIDIGYTKYGHFGVSIYYLFRDESDAISFRLKYDIS